jgi:hypothetical protein
MGAAGLSRTTVDAAAFADRVGERFGVLITLREVINWRRGRGPHWPPCARAAASGNRLPNAAFPLGTQRRAG